MSNTFLGFDHVDTRVRSLSAVEPFYDAVMPALGLGRKTYAHVDERGDWHDASVERPYNTVEYHEAPRAGRAARFIGFIEDPSMTPPQTRLAFRVERSELEAWFERLPSLDARNVEPSADMDGYPAIFFEDPVGTRLEFCARSPETTCAGI